MNKLYGLLIYGADLTDVSDMYYMKKFYPVKPTPRVLSIVKAIRDGVPKERLLMFACFLCNAVTETIFGDEIRRLDKENTYDQFIRDPDKSADDEALLLWDLTKPAKLLKPLYKWLDSDIQDRLVTPGWLDVMAALCLQVLREVA